jgi:hypothetical protein
MEGLVGSWNYKAFMLKASMEGGEIIKRRDIFFNEMTGGAF